MTVAGVLALADGGAALVALFLTPLFEDLPEATLGAIVIVAVAVAGAAVPEAGAGSAARHASAVDAMAITPRPRRKGDNTGAEKRGKDFFMVVAVVDARPIKKA